MNMNDNDYTYAKLNLRPEQLQKIKIMAAQRGVTMIELIEELLRAQETNQSAPEPEAA